MRNFRTFRYHDWNALIFAIWALLFNIYYKIFGFNRHNSICSKYHIPLKLCIDELNFLRVVVKRKFICTQKCSIHKNKIWINLCENVSRYIFTLCVIDVFRYASPRNWWIDSKEQHQSLHSFLYEVLPVLPILYLKHNAPALNHYRIKDKIFIDLFSGALTPWAYNYLIVFIIYF